MRCALFCEDYQHGYPFLSRDPDDNKFGASLKTIQAISLKELGTALLEVVMDMLDSPDGVPDSRLFHSGDKIIV